jgi:hypothetical protein
LNTSLWGQYACSSYDISGPGTLAFLETLFHDRRQANHGARVVQHNVDRTIRPAGDISNTARVFQDRLLVDDAVIFDREQPKFLERKRPRE